MWASNLDTIANVGKEKHPKRNQQDVQYGTAGFRTKAQILDHVMYRMGVLAAIRSKAKSGATIGVMITASHNPAPDNGVKLVDPAGEMLEAKWESLATKVANAPDSELASVINELVQSLQVNVDKPATVYVGRDTRPSSEQLSRAVLAGVTAAGGSFKDYGVVTTPQLHYFVVCQNTKGQYGVPTENGYFDKLVGSYKLFRAKDTSSSANYATDLQFDGANGVGAIAMKRMVDVVNAANTYMNVDINNDNVTDGAALNHNCGADFVKVQQKCPENVMPKPYQRCVSVDGDADRIVYFFVDDDGTFHLLDGDKIATLIAGYLKELLSESKLKLNLGLVQTAYANGSSTNYITNKLNVPVACVPTGVKHLHHRALDFDIGVYFEANGHGTVVFSPTAHEDIREASRKSRAAEKLELVMNITNQCVGDALADLLLVETILRARNWDVREWSDAYKDLPNRQLKVRVSDRNVIKTADAERQCVEPEGLQGQIDVTVKKFPQGRSFVRPSGTEDVVRVYAEADTKDNADQLAYEVGLLVHKMAGGVGEPTPKPQ